MYRKHSGEMEEDIHTFIKTRSRFSLKDIVLFLNRAGYRIPKEGKTELTRLLSRSQYLLSISGSNSYTHRSVFFRNFSFLVSPSPLEIKKGILIPGHRFIGVTDPHLLPWKITVQIDEATPAAHKTFKTSIPEILPFYTLFERRKIFSLLMKDKSKNSALLEGGGYDDVRITVLNMKDFYSQHSFKEGDSVEITVEDWEEGRCFCTFLSNRERKTRKKEDRNRGVNRLDRTLMEDFEQYGPLPAGDQLAHAYFSAGESAGQAPYISLETYLETTQKVILTDYMGSRCLWYSGRDPESIYLAKERIPRQARALYSLNVLLETSGLMLRERDIRAYFVHEHRLRKGSMEHAVNRFCPEKEDTFTADLLQDTFNRYCRDLWEETGKQPSRIQPAARTDSHSRALKLMDRHLALWRKIREDTVSEGKAYELLKILNPLYTDLSCFLGSFSLSKNGPVFRTLDNIEKNIAAIEDTFFGSGIKREYTCTLKIILKGTKPPVWRRIRIEEFCTLEDLHNALQIIMGWNDLRPHGFIVDRARYSPVVEGWGFDEKSEDERKYTIKDVLKTGRKKFTYIYDIERNWVHTIKIEAVEQKEEFPLQKEKTVTCLAGRRACPPPRCSGLADYTRILEEIAQGRNPLEFSRYNPAAFDKREVNEVLEEVFTL